MKKLALMLVLGLLSLAFTGCPNSNADKTPDGKPREAPGIPKDGV